MDENKSETTDTPNEQSQEGKFSQDIQLTDLTPVEASAGIDVSEYEGNKAKIELVDVIPMQSKYGDGITEVDGKVYKQGEQLPSGKTISTKVLKIQTEVLAEIDTADGKKPIRASELLGLKKKEDSSWGWSMHEKSKIQQLYKRLKLPVETNPNDLKDKVITVISRPSSDGETSWLGILI